MKTAIISLTDNGRLLSRVIDNNSSYLECDRYSYYEHSDDDSTSFNSLKVLVTELFSLYDALIFICACGIAVRMIAPLINSKINDPAVIVIDESGKYVIPILSGHIGGANALSERLAETISAKAIITTATDTNGHFSPDSFAMANNLIISDLNAAKLIAAAVLHGEKTGIVTDYEFINLSDDIIIDNNCHTGIYVGCNDLKPFPVTLSLIPRNIVIGIGCKRNTPTENIEKAIFFALNKANITFNRVICLSTIDIKANEKGLIEFCNTYNINLCAYSPQELMEVNGDFTSSVFVKSVTGSDNVCERSAIKYSNGKLLLKKTKCCGVTVAIAEHPIILDFGKKMI